MSKRGLAALAGVLLCGAGHAQTYVAVADWLKVPAGREGQMHGDIAVSRAGELNGRVTILDEAGTVVTHLG